MLYQDSPDKKFIQKSGLGSIDGRPFSYAIPQENRTYLEPAIKQYIESQFIAFEQEVQNNPIKYQNDRVEGDLGYLNPRVFTANFSHGQTVTALESRLFYGYIGPIITRYIPFDEAENRLGAVMDYINSDELLNKFLLAGPVLKNYYYRQAMGYNDPYSNITANINLLIEVVAGVAVGAAAIGIVGAATAGAAVSSEPFKLPELPNLPLPSFNDLVANLPNIKSPELSDLIKNSKAPATPATPSTPAAAENSEFPWFILIGAGILAKILLFK